jgi:hypothetical protein
MLFYKFSIIEKIKKKKKLSKSWKLFLAKGDTSDTFEEW